MDFPVGWNKDLFIVRYLRHKCFRDFKTYDCHKFLNRVDFRRSFSLTNWETPMEPIFNKLLVLSFSLFSR